MMISYAGLEQRLKERSLTKSSLTKQPGLSSRTVAKIAKSEKPGKATLGKIADYLDCEEQDTCRFPIALIFRKNYYYRSLSKWRNEKGRLTGTCLDGQDTFKCFIEALDIPYGESLIS